MNQSLVESLLGKIDDIKTSITDQQYREILSDLSAMYDKTTSRDDNTRYEGVIYRSHDLTTEEDFVDRREGTGTIISSEINRIPDGGRCPETVVNMKTLRFTEYETYNNIYMGHIDEEKLQIKFKPRVETIDQVAITYQSESQIPIIVTPCNSNNGDEPKSIVGVTCNCYGSPSTTMFHKCEISDFKPCLINYDKTGVNIEIYKITEKTLKVKKYNRIEDSYIDDKHVLIVYTLTIPIQDRYSYRELDEYSIIDQDTNRVSYQGLKHIETLFEKHEGVGFGSDPLDDSVMFLVDTIESYNIDGKLVLTKRYSHACLEEEIEHH